MTGTAGLGRAVQGLILSGPVALFSLGTATDAAYLRTAEMQWSNFSSWAIVGGLMFGGAAFVWSLNHHWTKALTASADGSTLYVGIGSNSNAGERGMAVEEERAVVWAVDRSTGARRTIARGIRNPTALAIEPSSAALWAVVNERDEIGPQLVPDYLTSVRDGAFYGWPYSYWGQNLDPRVRPQKPELVATAIKPDYALGAHVAALGLSFARDGGFGGAFTEGAFIGQHGSWNRQDLAGYKVAWVPFSGGRPAGEPVDFLTGFLTDNGEARGRPVGVWFDPQRRILLVADDLSNTVWRVAPAGISPAR